MEKLLKSKKIYFVIDSNNKLSLDLPCSLKKVSFWDFGDIFFHHQSRKKLMITSYEPAFIEMRSLVAVLENILINKKEIPYELEDDIGLIYQKILKGVRKRTPFVITEGKKCWEGAYYKIWSNGVHTTTWLYMKNEVIWLEITPNYPWTFDTPQPSEKFYSFNEFIKNYKPIAQFTLNQETAQEWLEQARFLIKTIEETSKRLEDDT